MEYDKQIEIKLDGNNCIINIPPDQNISSKSLNKILAQNNNSLTNIDDISFSVSLTSEDNMNSKNNLYNYNYGKNIINENYINNENYMNNDNNNNYLYSNEKSKLEITYQSIFYSDLKSDTSNMKTPLLLLNSKKNDEIQQKKDSVVKRLNFDLNNSNSNTNINKNSNYINNSNNNKINNISNMQKEILKNINKINTEIQNINIRKLPLINKNNNNIVKKLSKNLNKEYFIHEKIYSSNKNEKENKNLERIKLDKKIKENIVKIENNNKTPINKNNINSNIEMPNINNRQITEKCLSKVKSNSNFLLNKKSKNNLQENNKINSNHLLLYKCPSKPNISDMKLRLNNMLKVNPKIEKDKDKENLDINPLTNANISPKENNNNIHNEIEFIQIIKPNNNNLLNQKEKEIKKLYPRLTSANIFNTATKTSNLKSYNSYNQSAKISKLQKNNLNANNSNFKSPPLVNKQIILCTPKTNSYTCSTSYSAKNNKSPKNNNKNFENKSSDLKMENNKLLKNINKDPILCKIEAHNSLLRNFFLNPNNFKKQEKSDEYLTTNNNNLSNNKDNDKLITKKYLDESINTNKMSLRKFNTDLKIPLKKTKQLGLLTERNLNNNNYYNNNNYQLKYNNANDLQKLIKKNEFDMELWNSIKK